MIEDIQDDYPEFLDDQLGYAWDAWDVLGSDEIRRHDAIAASTAEELAGLDPEAMDDLDRWAFARAARRLGDADAFLRATRLLLDPKGTHRGLEYREIFAVAVQVLGEQGAFEEAELHLQVMSESWPHDTDVERLSARVAFLSDPARGTQAFSSLLARWSDQPELLFEVATDLVALGDRTFAETALQACVEAAQATGEEAALVDVALLREELSRVPISGPATGE